MPGRADGGRTALTGFLYQMLAALGLGARAHLCLHGAATAEDEDEFQTLVRVVAAGRLEHEVNDQDAGVRLVDAAGIESLVLIQFKYSGQRRPPNITADELREIVRRLRASALRAERDGITTTGYKLITNRPANEDALELRRKARGTARSVAGLNRPERDVLAKLSIIADVAQRDWTTNLEAFARKYGAVGDEILQGIGWLVTELLAETVAGGNTEVTLARLVHAFTKYPDARRLTEDAVRDLTRPALDARLQPLGLRGDPVPRGPR